MEEVPEAAGTATKVRLRNRCCPSRSQSSGTAAENTWGESTVSRALSCSWERPGLMRPMMLSHHQERCSSRDAFPSETPAAQTVTATSQFPAKVTTDQS